jgi:two-component system, LytTR family, sensor kinase
VLLKQTEQANAMLTRLSSFLRHTLVNEAGSQVTVAEEVETLKLYLDIERMRFEERLRTDFRIDDAASNALLPSLLLQPLVENAIKYAVSPLEEGAQIRVTAQIVGRMLRVTVSDTGPGAHDSHDDRRIAAGNPSCPEPVSTGVGLANIRDRLSQAYGDNHTFEIRTPAQGGFTVIIEIPHEEGEQEQETLPKNVVSLHEPRRLESNA